MDVPSIDGQQPVVMCLYPGIYTPGLPATASLMGRDLASSAEYLANRSPPSSYGSDIAANAYILNLTSCGGYIDGLATQSQYYDDGERRQEDVGLDGGMDANPSACGQLVNHDADGSNVEVCSFAWEDLLSKHGDSTTTATDDCYAIPNELRADGTPWYYDMTSDELISFPKRDETPLPRRMLCGAALILTKPIRRGEELLLDYGLREPYPEWAKGWYRGTTA